MQNEMNQLFAEGGVMQEGGTVDPVSGNDVPPGAMAEEVRDDIDAKLSEGEFVIPADVVRYIGLEKLMMMRDKAKAGLKKMAEIGQMGNAEEVKDAEALHGGEDEMDDDTFSSEIDSIMGEDSEQEYAAGGDVRKYAPGGIVSPANAQFIRNEPMSNAQTAGMMGQPTYVGGSTNESLYRDAPIRGFEMVEMVNDAGQTIYIPFINGRPQLSIPQGYKVKSSDMTTTTPTPETPTPVTTPQTTDGGGAGGADAGDGGGNSNAAIGMNASISPEGIVSNSPVSVTAAGIVGAALSTALGLGPVSGFTAGKNAATSVNAANATTVAAANAAIADTMGLNANNTSQAAITAEESAAGTQGVTGGSAASAGANAAAAAAANGMSAAAQGAASQAAADATISGADSASAAAAGAAAAAAAAASEGLGVGGIGGDGDGGVSGIGADGIGFAKGGFVSKKKTKTASKPTGLAARRK
jgi:hypothetical protein